MPDFNPVGLGKRLKLEMERQQPPLDVKALQARVIEKAGAMRGTSYGSIWSYVKGQAPLEPRREVIDALASVLGVLPSYLLAGGPRTPEEKDVADLAAERAKGNFLEALVDCAIPEFNELEIDAQGLLIQALARFRAAAPRDWFPPDDKTRPYAVHLVAFLATLRQAVFMPLWAWSDKPDLSEPATSDYIRGALAAFILSIPRQLPRPPTYRLEMYDGQSTDKPHGKPDWVRWETAIRSRSLAPRTGGKRKAGKDSLRKEAKPRKRGK